MILNKTYPNSNHLDSLSVTGTISSGSATVFVNGKAIARNGDSITASDCSGVTIKQGSTNVMSN